jgi:RNA polymerase sigma-70 factor (ECF subfamily)
VQIDEAKLFDAQFRVHARQVHTYALRRSDPETAQEVAAETFLIAWRRRHEMPSQPLPWLYGIARRVLMNEHRAANRRNALGARLAAGASRDPDAAGDDRILEALGALGEGDREALLLSAWEGLSAREAGAVLQCSAATFAVRLHRARGRLSRALEQTQTDLEPAHASGPISEVPR